ncbi:hypothetical protein [Natronomonas sp.]|uniref:hypothetical protein n=1 Tax=Natronomonas sp. TaxID=2184060 RepID=UPI00261641E2|nr:hypothetical protein [Natronomonas sp.]
MSQSGPGQRETAYRLFAAEFEDSELSYSESDEERAPNYVVTPTGARVNRLFAVGVLTEIEDVNPEMVRGRVVDPTGAFVTYAGQYQPDALAFLERVDPPLFLALSGKARTYEPEDGDRIFTSVRPESVNEVDAETRDRWVVTAAERTLERVGVAAAAIDSGLSGDRLESALLDAGVEEGLAEGVALAVEHYGTTPAYLDALRGLAIDAVRVVAGERDEVDRLGVAPDEGGGDASSLSTLELSAPEATARSAGTAGTDSPDDPGSVGADPVETSPEPSGAGAGAGEVETSREPGADSDATPGTTFDPAEGAGSGAGGATEPTAPTGSSAADGPATTEPGSDPDPDPNPDGAETAATVDASGSERDAAAGSDPDGAGSTRDEQASSGAEAPTAGTGTGTATGTETGAASDTGDSEPGGVDSESGEADPDGFDPGEFELDDEERREVEEEYGTEFSTAGEVDPPESADTPEAAATGGQTEATPDPSAAPEPADAEPRADAEAASETDESAPNDAEAGTGSEEGDLVDAVMDAMKDLDEGEGADREALIDAVADERGVSADAVEESIQEALMSGRCYEPSDDALKPI